MPREIYVYVYFNQLMHVCCKRGRHVPLKFYVRHLGRFSLPYVAVREVAQIVNSYSHSAFCADVVRSC